MEPKLEIIKRFLARVESSVKGLAMDVRELKKEIWQDNDTPQAEASD